MNILYLNHYAGSPALGMEYRPYYLAREWVRAGHRVQIVAADFSHVRARQPPAGDETIDGIAPSPETISNGTYPLARSLYIYVKKAHIGVTPGLQEFLIEFTSEAAVGRGGYLQDRGLVPLPEAELVQQRSIATALTSMARPE